MEGVVYLQPGSVAEASGFLTSYPGARLLAGGTDLVLAMERKKVTPSHLVDLSGVPGINSISYQEGKLHLGSMVTIQELVDSPVIKEKFPVIASAASWLGCWQVRNRATLGGNLANAAPSAEMAPPLMALGAMVKIAGSKGERVLPLEEFFTGPGQTVLQPGEIMTEVVVADQPAGARSIYLRHALRKSMDISLSNAAVSLTLAGDTVTGARVVLGAVAPTPIRSRAAEAALAGRKPDSEVIAAAAAAAAGECRPITDVRATAEYRREMIEVLVRRALNSILKPEGGDQ